MADLIYYSLRDLPDGLDELEELDLELKWETVMEPGTEKFTGIDELNELLRERIRKLLKEKGGECVHMKHEKIAHSRNYAHMSLVVTGEYRFVLMGRKRESAPG